MKGCIGSIEECMEFHGGMYEDAWKTAYMKECISFCGGMCGDSWKNVYMKECIKFHGGMCGDSWRNATHLFAKSFNELGFT